MSNVHKPPRLFQKFTIFKYIQTYLILTFKPWTSKQQIKTELVGSLRSVASRFHSQFATHFRIVLASFLDEPRFPVWCALLNVLRTAFNVSFACGRSKSKKPGRFPSFFLSYFELQLRCLFRGAELSSLTTSHPLIE